MTRIIPSKFLLPGGMKQLRVEFTAQRDWMIWLNANGDFTNGIFIRLCGDGEIHRVTWHPDGGESVFVVKEIDNE